MNSLLQNIKAVGTIFSFFINKEIEVGGFILYFVTIQHQTCTKIFPAQIPSIASNTLIFCFFAVAGDVFFSDVLQVRFAAFLLFGGIIFIIIGVRFVFEGPGAVELLRGPPEHISRSVAIPFMIGPGTINASVLAGSKSSPGGAFAAIAGAVVLTVVIVVGLKMVHDYVSRKNEAVVQRYADLCGRMSVPILQYSTDDFPGHHSDDIFFNLTHLNLRGATLLSEMVGRDLRRLLGRGMIRAPAKREAADGLGSRRKPD